MLRTALALASKTIAVFPCRPRDKRPATEHGVKDATVDPAVITAWWQHTPDFNLAIATGSVSGIFAVDIDGLDAELELRQLESAHGALPPTVESITGRGRHLFFKMPPTPLGSSVGKIAAGIDTRGDAGYVLAPPSIHPSGKRYEWSVDSASSFADAPTWLLEKITAPARSATQPTPPSEWRSLLAAGVGEGCRNSTVTKLSGYLLRRFVDPIVVLELVQLFNAMRCTPPLPPEDVERAVNSICGKELRRRGGNG